MELDESQQLVSAPRLRRKTSRGVMDPHWFFKNFSLRCYNPSPRLVPFVEHFFIIRWDPKQQPSPRFDYILTEPAITMFLGKRQQHIHGIVAEKTIFTLSGDGVEVGIKFAPGGLHSFWGHDISSLTHRVVPAATVFPEITSEFLEKLYATDNDASFVEVLEKFLTDYQVEPDKNLLLIQRIAQSIHDNDCTTVAEIAERFNVHERTLHHLFKRRVGVGVKWLLMRPRLLEAVQHATSLSKPDWTRVAADLGYNTQSHFVNDFKKYIGVSPSKYVQALENKDDMPSL
jgi:AraC-like DNA-binding protein